MLSCRAGNGLSVEFERTRSMLGVAWAEVGLIAGGGRRVKELVFGCRVSLSSGVRGSGKDLVAEMKVWLLFIEFRDGPDEVEDA